MQEAGAQRMYDQLHDERPYHDGTFTNWSKEPSQSTPFHANDGVRIYVAEVDVNPTDDFLSPPDLIPSFTAEPES